MKAYQIMDLHNPVSQHYAAASADSFRDLKSKIEIQAVQCTTPSTLGLILDDSKQRSPTEKAVLESHYNLVGRLREGEQFLILEHDAYLWPDRRNDFEILLTKVDQRSVWLAGIAMECYTMCQPVAEIFCNLIETDFDHNHRGPMSMLHAAGMQYSQHHKTRVIWPKYGETGKLIHGTSISQASRGKGVEVDAPVTQYVNLEIGVTVDRFINGKQKRITRKHNPNVFFGDDESK